MERGVKLVRCRKISCESDEFDDIVVNLKNDVLSRNNMPKIILETGPMEYQECGNYQRN